MFTNNSKAPLLLALAVTFAGAAVGIACASDDSADEFRRGGKPVNTGSSGNGGEGGTGPNIPSGPGSGPPPVPSLQIRVAALDDGIGAFDFCVAPAALPDDGGPVATTGPFVGPVMEGSALPLVSRQAM